MAADEATADFIGELTAHQIHLKAFFLSSLGNYADALDVLQQTNTVLWRKSSEFRRGSPFMPWALGIARYEILAFSRSRQRDRHVFCADVVELMVDIATDRAADFSPRSDALRDCIMKLSESNREFLRIRYGQEHSVKQIAAKTGRSVEAVKQLYHRIRLALSDCIDRRLTAETR